MIVGTLKEVWLGEHRQPHSSDTRGPDTRANPAAARTHPIAHHSGLDPAAAVAVLDATGTGTGPALEDLSWPQRRELVRRLTRGPGTPEWVEREIRPRLRLTQAPAIDQFVIAWRSWTLVEACASTSRAASRRDDDPSRAQAPCYLSATSHHSLWLPGARTEARCEADGPLHAAGEGAPAELCQCGLWAYKHAESLIAAGPPDAGGRVFPMYAVVGPVALWGDLIEHELGFRAEYGYPLALIIVPVGPDAFGPHGAAAADHLVSALGIYDVPVVLASCERSWNAPSYSWIAGKFIVEMANSDLSGTVRQEAARAIPQMLVYL